jgi:hypothetical protein
VAHSDDPQVCSDRDSSLPQHILNQIGKGSSLPVAKVAVVESDSRPSSLSFLKQTSSKESDVSRLAPRAKSVRVSL